MKILVDMNLSPEWARFLAEAGFEAVHWSKVGSKTATDSELGPVLSCDEFFTERIRIKGGTPFFGGFANQLLTDSWAVGSRRADRWSALDYATTSGSGSRMSCLDVRGTWAAQRKIIDCSSKRFSTDLELGVLGVIYRSVSAPGKRSINVSADGQRAGFSSAFSNC